MKFWFYEIESSTNIASLCYNIIYVLDFEIFQIYLLK
jgi:hypothetical protein